MSFPRYPKYKDSGVEWLGEVPEHWEVIRLKHLLAQNDGGVWGIDPTGDKDTVVLRSTEQTVDGRWQIEDPAWRTLSDADRDAALLEEGDLLLTKSSGSSLHIGKTSLVDSEVASLQCCYSNFMQRLRTNAAFLPKLAWFFLNNQVARLQFEVLANSTTGLANLNGTVIGDVVVPVASVPEQTAIAAFLDHETAKIDALIAEQQRLIELLQEKRQAVISHAVTKGLNPDAPMKDSGIEWLGEVPEHWEVVPLKYTCSLLKDGTHLPPARTAEGIPLLSVRNVIDGKFVLRDDDSLISRESYADLSRSFVPQVDDILLAIVGATLGKTAVVPAGLGEFHIQRSLGIFRVRDEILLPRFLNAVFTSTPFQSKLWELVGYSAQPGIYLGTLQNLRIPVPPRHEQTVVVDALEKASDTLNLLLADVGQSITLLQERRSALISAAVTGQIDIRNCANEGAAA